MTDPDAAKAIEFMRVRLEGCSRGGVRSGKTRRAESKRPLVESVIRNRRRANTYSREAAREIANYLGVSVRYVRYVAKDMDAPKRK